MATSSDLPDKPCETQTPPNTEDTLVQYIVLRKDLKKLKWGAGSISAQACHGTLTLTLHLIGLTFYFPASTAAMWTFREDQHVVDYMSAMDHMHKVVLAASDEVELRSTSEQLTSNGVDHKLWVWKLYFLNSATHALILKD